MKKYSIIYLILVFLFIGRSEAQNTMNSPVDLGTKNTSFTFTDTKNTTGYTNDYVGRPSNDVFYKFTITKTADIIISHCGSQVSDTYVHLLNASGVRIAYNDDDNTGTCSNRLNSYLRSEQLPPGVYYVVSEGYSQNGNITTMIQGIIGDRVDNVSLNTGKNYVVKVTPLDATGKLEISDANVTADNGTRMLISVQYFDGLGRGVQTIEKGIAPNGADLITVQTYDNAGRAGKTYLPVPVSGNNGNYAPVTTQSSYYSDTHPYSEVEYEASPLNRVEREFGPGQAWRVSSGKAVSTYMYTNNSTALLSCALYKVTTDGKLQRSGVYSSGSLYVTQTKDEDGNESYQFTDKLNRTILTRQVNNTSEYIDTYFVFDDFGSLRYVLPPSAADELNGNGIWSISDNGVKGDALRNYAYIYKYDHRARCIEKKLPGADPIYYVYDKADRLILTQDGNQRSKSPKEWLYKKYDAFGRVIVTGVYTPPSYLPESVVRNTMFENEIVKEAPGSGAYGYTWNTGTSLSSDKVLTVNYYDNYDFLSGLSADLRQSLAYEAGTGFDEKYTSTKLGSGSAKGALTGTRVKMTDQSKEIVTAVYYDGKNRPVQTKTTNHLSGIDKEYASYDFAGNPKKKRLVHGICNVVENYRYEYDRTGRLKETWHKMDNQAEILMSDLTYDNLGRMISKRLHNGAETVNYTYTIRNWTKSISSSRFRETLYYQDNRQGTTPYYNGNISSMEWKIKDESFTRGYKFTYDKLSRLTEAAELVSGTKSYSGSWIYDKQGNIRSITQYGPDPNTGASVLMHSLSLQYTGNRLRSVNNAVLYTGGYGSQHFVDGATADTEYFYDNNGNMSGDSNKGITKIKYNLLNLPDRLQFRPGHMITYSYDAAGVKRRVETVTSVGNVNVAMGEIVPLTSSDILVSSVADYCGNVVYFGLGTGVSRLLTGEGYVNRQYGMFGDWVYTYTLKDHLGSVRYEFDQSGTTRGYTHYYPFGAEYAESGTPSLKPERYTGQEFDGNFGLNTYDYIARGLDGILGRFNQPDPLAEKYYSWSPYVYCGNNPLKYIDPNGEQIYLYYTDENGKSQKYIFDPQEDYEGDNLFIKSFYEAYQYLNENGVSNVFDEFIGNEKNSISIVESTGKTKSKLNGSYKLNKDSEQSVGTVYWNPSQGLRKFKDITTGKEGRLSPSVALLHEMGHGYDVLKEGIGGVYLKYKMKIPDYDNVAEQFVIWNYENPAAEKLGQGIRSNHRGKLFTTSGVNSTLTPKEENKKNKK